MKWTLIAMTVMLTLIVTKWWKKTYIANTVHSCIMYQ